MPSFNPGDIVVNVPRRHNIASRSAGISAESAPNGETGVGCEPIGAIRAFGVYVVSDSGQRKWKACLFPENTSLISDVRNVQQRGGKRMRPADSGVLVPIWKLGQPAGAERGSSSVA